MDLKNKKKMAKLFEQSLKEERAQKLQVSRCVIHVILCIILSYQHATGMLKIRWIYNDNENSSNMSSSISSSVTTYIIKSKI